ncbi:MAG: substrate-binding domain-containing protein [Cytophagales bacterium]|nr:substrate-binding domain-containing protein [Cytophagales bacterium]MDW8383526.1 hypothetical protein [Flammeovirgaceae bacterium]
MMKFRVFFLVMFFSYQIFAQNGNNEIIITGTRFTYSLIERWAEAFCAQYPQVRIRIIPRGAINADSAHLIINAHKLHPEEIRGGDYVINVARYAILPIANANHPLLAEWTKKPLKTKTLQQLYFKKYDIFSEEEESKKSKKEYKPTVYTRAQKACAPLTFARYYGFQQEDIFGKLIGGDDKYLITAIEKDTNGITFSPVSIMFDLKTRRIRPTIAAIPMDFNENGKLDEDENFSSLDELLKRLENGRVNVPIEYINISYRGQLIEKYPYIYQFLTWILSEGQNYNHQEGFLKFDSQTSLFKQIEILEASKGGR